MKSIYLLLIATFVSIFLYAENPPIIWGPNDSAQLLGSGVLLDETGSTVAKPLIGGTDITLVETGTDITINSTAAGGGSAPFTDATAIIKNDADATKLIKLNASAITTSTTRTINMPDNDVDLIDAPGTCTVGSIVTWANTGCTAVFNNTGATVANNDVVATTGSAASPSLRMNNTNSGFYRFSSFGIAAAVNGVDLWRWDTNRNISFFALEPSTNGTLAFGTNTLAWGSSHINTMRFRNFTMEDPTDEGISQSITPTTVDTTDATVTTLFSRNPATSESFMLTATITAVRTGGTAGTDGDTAVYVRTMLCASNSSDVIHSTTATATIQIEDNSNLALDLDNDGTFCRVRATGAVDNDYTWFIKIDMIGNNF